MLWRFVFGTWNNDVNLCFLLNDFFPSGMDVNMGRVIQKATAAVVVPLPLSLPRIGSFPRGFLVM